MGAGGAKEKKHTPLPLDSSFLACAWCGLEKGARSQASRVSQAPLLPCASLQHTRSRALHSPA